MKAGFYKVDTARRGAQKRPPVIRRPRPRFRNHRMGAESGAGTAKFMAKFAAAAFMTFGASLGGEILYQQEFAPHMQRNLERAPEIDAFLARHAMEGTGGGIGLLLALLLLARRPKKPRYRLFKEYMLEMDGPRNPKQIGSGGFGTVYLGMDRRSELPVAIKRIRCDRDAIKVTERTRREAEMMKKMQDAIKESGLPLYVPAFIEIIETEVIKQNGISSLPGQGERIIYRGREVDKSSDKPDYIYLVMEYVEGMDLAREIEMKDERLVEESKILELFGIDDLSWHDFFVDPEHAYEDPEYPGVRMQMFKPDAKSLIEASTLIEGIRMKLISLLEYSPKQVLRRILRIVQCLRIAYEKLGVFHRDIKPQNIRINPDGIEPYVRVMDWGISKDPNATKYTKTGRAIGSEPYMPPECFVATLHDVDISHKADIYALGLIMYEMLAGYPYKNDDLRQAHAFEVPEEIDGLHDAFQSLIKRMLMKDPRFRYTTVEKSRLLEEIPGIEGKLNLFFENPGEEHLRFMLNIRELRKMAIKAKANDHAQLSKLLSILNKPQYKIEEIIKIVLDDNVVSAKFLAILKESHRTDYARLEEEIKQILKILSKLS